MSAYRITQKSLSTSMMNGLQTNLSKLQKIQEQLSSGKQISRPSDSPVKTVESMQFRGELRRTEQYVRNADDGLAMLGSADTALMSSLDLTNQARDRLLQAMNGSVNQQGRDAIAAEIDALSEALRGIANARYLDRPVFGGNMTGEVAYPAPGGTYAGDDGAVIRTVAAGTQVEVNVTGPEVFGAITDAADPGGSTQLFDVLAGMSAVLRGGTDPKGVVTGLDQGLGKLDIAKERVITALGVVGARYNRVDVMRTRAEDQLVSLTNSLSEVESIDLPRTIVDLQMQEVAYQAALGATARVVQPSLLDFLR